MSLRAVVVVSHEHQGHHNPSLQPVCTKYMPVIVSHKDRRAAADHCVQRAAVVSQELGMPQPAMLLLVDGPHPRLHLLHHARFKILSHSLRGKIEREKSMAF